MSGGSYDYLYAGTSLEDLLGKRHQLEQMADRLAGLDEAEFPGSTAAARETAYLLNLVRVWENHCEARMALVRDVWHAVEWWDSGDYGAGQVAEVLRDGLGGLVEPTPDATAAPVGEVGIPEDWRMRPPQLASEKKPDDRPPFRPHRDPWPTADGGFGE
jgi:hypothetical protein